MTKRAVRKRPPLLVHHKHTGKRLHHRHTSYPVVVFLLLIVGVFTANFSQQVRADDVAVNAVVLGDPPSAPAVITSPSDGDRFTTKPITVSGTCPGDQPNMVKLYRNNFFSGAVLCASDDTFTLQTDLFPGANELEAKIFNLANVEGPNSPTITVYYDPPPQPEPPAGQAGSPGGNAGFDNSGGAGSQFTIKTDNIYKGYYTGEQISWEIEALGGAAPYAFTVDWGDGTTSTYSRREAGSFKIYHIYDRGGDYRGNFIIRITAADANQNAAFVQLSIIINDKANPLRGVPATTNQAPGSPLDNMLGYLWPAYLVVLLMVSCFWLGQRREYAKLAPRLRGRKV